jgi:hypothetical protein
MSKGWNFAVYGLRSNDAPERLGVTDTYEQAIELKRNMTQLGWNGVAIYDAALQEVEGKPK